jgi:hypothetical protein
MEKMPNELKHVGELSKFSGGELLKALQNIDKIPVPTVGESYENDEKKKLESNLELIRHINGAEEEIARQGNIGLTISLKKLKLGKIPEPIWERLTNSLSGEVYVVGTVLDGSGKSFEFKTQLFRGMKDDQELPLGSGGLLVSYLVDPRWFVDIHLVVMESDSEYRKVGEAMDKARADSKIDNYLEMAKALFVLDPTKISTILGGFNLFYSLLTDYLKNNGDDHLGTIHDFYLKHQAFGMGTHGPQKYSDIEATYSIDLTQM